MRDIVVCLCDITGIFAKPWVAAGYRTILIDPQHPKTDTDFVGGVMRVAEPIHTGRMPEVLERYADQVCFVMGFPPCQELCASGSRWWKSKEEREPGIQQRAAEFAMWCAELGILLGVPWQVENPKGALTRLWRKWDYMFSPWQFTGETFKGEFCVHDSYLKETCIFMGNGVQQPKVNVHPEVQSAVNQVEAVFGRMVPPKRVRDWFGADSEIAKWYPSDKIHFASPGAERANLRSGTPLGWSNAVFRANRSLT